MPPHYPRPTYRFRHGLRRARRMKAVRNRNCVLSLVRRACIRQAHADALGLLSLPE
jgi:hypothetical protein